MSYQIGNCSATPCVKHTTEASACYADSLGKLAKAALRRPRDQCEAVQQQNVELSKKERTRACAAGAKALVKTVASVSSTSLSLCTRT
jgi:hypothetical protein